jgi:tetratricopeptide (TPR) repeat protein
MNRALAALLAVLLAAGVAAERAVAWVRRDQGARLQAEMVEDLHAGTLARLLRCRLRGLRLLVTRPEDGDARAVAAFASALLVSDFGLPTLREAAALADGAEGVPEAGPRRRALIGATRALVALAAGDRAAAGAHARRAAEASHGEAYALLALARVVGRSGDLPGASRALEAAMVKEPGLRPVRLDWAIGRVDLGDAAAAVALLRPLVQAEPRDALGLLLLAEAERARVDGGAAAGSPASASGEVVEARCREQAPRSPALAARCALDAAARARLEGRRVEALAAARQAAAGAGSEPRLLGAAAQILAQVGDVDAAAHAAAEAARLGGGPAAAWASVAVALGRGVVAAEPLGLGATSPETRLLSARAAWAAGGPAALAATVAELGARALAVDPDLAALALLADAGSAAALERAEQAAVARGPPGAYVAGVAARLAGARDKAVDWLARALDGHGDACRAAGEHLSFVARARPPRSARRGPAGAARQEQRLRQPRHHRRAKPPARKQEPPRAGQEKQGARAPHPLKRPRSARGTARDGAGPAPSRVTEPRLPGPAGRRPAARKIVTPARGTEARLPPVP